MITGITFGAFDLLHPGHVHFLGYCKERCDELIVGLHTDPSIERDTKSTPIQTVFERYLQLISCKYVDIVFPYDTELDIENIIACFDIQKRFLGSDYEKNPEKITGYGLCLDKNIKLEFIPRLHSYSSTELRERIRWA